MTIYEIAHKAGVSIATVSRALNPATRGKVRPATLEKIDALVGALGYAPNQAARNLGRCAFKTVGVLMPHHRGIFEEDYYTRLLAGLSDTLLESDYQLKLVMLKCEKPRWDHYDFKSAHGIDGLVITHWRAFFSDKSVLENLRLPGVIINDAGEKIRARFVTADHEEGGRLAAGYFYEQGHRRFGLLTGPADSIDSRLRENGFRDFLKSKGIDLDPRFVHCGEFQEAKAFEHAQLFKKPPRGVSAVFCANDAMAFGLIRGLRAQGIRVPEDISVAGYDDDRRGESFDPPLTSIQAPLYEIASESAAWLLRDLQENPERAGAFPPGKVLLKPVRLVVRKSVLKIAEEL